MDSNKVNMTPEHEIIVRHLRKSRDLGKHILTVSNGYGSALIEHKFKLTTLVSDRIEMITEITFMPNIRLYKSTGSKIVDDESLLNEDIEKC